MESIQEMELSILVTYLFLSISDRISRSWEGSTMKPRECESGDG